AALKTSRHKRFNSPKADRFQIFVGLDDLAQPIFRGAVAAIGVGMMPLHQRFEPRFDLMRGGVRLKPERVERFALGISHCPGFCRAAPGFLACTTRCAELPENAEWIIRAGEFRMKSGRVGARTGPSAAHPHFPSRTMADDGFFLITANILGAHPREEIVRMVVFAHMFQTKPQYSRSRSRPLGARWVAGAAQFGHSQAGHCARSRRSLSGLTRMRSNRGESLVMTDQYARVAEISSSLDNCICTVSSRVDL